MAPPPRNPDAASTAYLWKDIPREVWTEAKVKAAREDVTMKQVLEMLLRAWVAL